MKRMASVDGGGEEKRPAVGSQFDAMDVEDLRNMLTDAGIPFDGRWSKEKLVNAAEAAAKASEAA